MTLDQKIGQLFIIPACELRGEDHFEDLKALLQSGRAGGVILKQGTAAGQRRLIDALQGWSPLPLLAVQDGEWGTAMRLSDTPAFPKNMTLGAVQNLPLLYQLGAEIGRQCLLAGAHINLAPVVDVNSNPRNPIIHMRSFGEDPIEVAVRGDLIAQGIQSQGVIACMKHFPGHGDTEVDSHVGLPLVSHGREHLEEVELFPFQQLIASGVKAVMSAHLLVPSLSDVPATFSQEIVEEVLRNELAFSGLILTDALNMKALSATHSPGQIAVQAFLAGHDLLLYGDHVHPYIDRILRSEVPEAFAAIKEAVAAGVITEEQIDRRVAKILRAKEDLGLFEDRSCPPIENLSEELHKPSARALKKKLYEEAMTLVANSGAVPLQKGRIGFFEWGEAPHFKQRMLDAGAELLDWEAVNEYACIVLSLAGWTAELPHFGIQSEEKALLERISASGVPVAAVVFGTPYAIAHLPKYNAILAAYEKVPEAQHAAADAMLGRLAPRGRLPVKGK